MNSDASSTLSAARPFPGLRPFAFGDHEFFFGREDQSFELYRRLDRGRFLAVLGSSGSGKSSLVCAGLWPLLEAETIEEGNRGWSWVEFRPGDTPLVNLAAALAALAPDGDDPAADAGRRERFIFELRQSSHGIGDVLDLLGTITGRILILVDQFEEIFRYAAAAGRDVRDRAVAADWREEAIQLVQHLLQATRNAAHPVYVLLTMRSDFIGDCARFHGLPETISANQFLVPFLTRYQREQVIRGPIDKAGATIEPVLVERLLNDSENDFDQLPVLQHCLQRLWEEASRCIAEKHPPHLTFLHYQAIGGFEQALSAHADEVLASLAEDALAVEQTFRALSEVDREGRATRRALSLQQLRAEAGSSEPILSRVLDRFRDDDCSFLVPPRSIVPDLAATTRIDVGHEALLRRWDKISRDPVTGVEAGQDRGGWLWQEEADGRTYRALLALTEGGTSSHGATLPLDQVESRWAWWNERPRTAAWGERYGGHIDRVRRLFDDSLVALTTERDRQAAADRAEQERMQATARAQIAEAQISAERRLARRTRIAAAVLGILTVLAAGCAVYGLYQKRVAEAAKEQAVAAKEQAVAAKEQAVRWSETAGMISCVQEHALRSLGTVVPTSITFVNASTHTIRVYWLDWSGTRKAYPTIAPGQRLPLTTYISHYWVLADQDDKCFAIYQPEPFEREVDVDDTFWKMTHP